MAEMRKDLRRVVNAYFYAASRFRHRESRAKPPLSHFRPPVQVEAGGWVTPLLARTTISEPERTRS